MTYILPYHRWIKLLVHAGYWNLRVLEESLMQHPEHRHASCTVLTLTEDEALEASRSATDEDFALPSKCRVNRDFVIEGLSSEMVEKAGSAFDIEPEFFANHLRATTWEYYDGRSNAIPLPSIRKQLNFWTLEYWECVQLIGSYRLGSARLRPHEPVFRRMFVRSPCRHGDEQCTVALISRFVSYWESVAVDGCSNRVILIDSPLSEFIEFEYDDSEGFQVCSTRWAPYQGGPLDIANLKTRKSFLQRYPQVSNGRQESVKELLISRLNFPGLFLPANDGAPTTVAILQRIVLSHWDLTLLFLRRDFDSVNLGDLTNDTVNTSHAKYTLRNLGSCRNLLERCSVITRRNLDHLQIVPGENGSKTIKDADTTGELLRLDWLSIFDKIQHCINETDQLISIRLASLSVLDSKRSHADSVRNAMLSHSSNQINKLGQLFILFFTPAAFAYGVLSMGGDFLPGNKKFWIFWAVAIPLSIVTNVIFYLWKIYTYRSHGMRVE